MFRFIGYPVPSLEVLLHFMYLDVPLKNLWRIILSIHIDFVINLRLNIRTHENNRFVGWIITFFLLFYLEFFIFSSSLFLVVRYFIFFSMLPLLVISVFNEETFLISLTLCIFYEIYWVPSPESDRTPYTHPQSLLYTFSTPFWIKNFLCIFPSVCFPPS